MFACVCLFLGVFGDIQECKIGHTGYQKYFTPKRGKFLPSESYIHVGSSHRISDKKFLDSFLIDDRNIKIVVLTS